ncbi:MAG: hypothetical protein AB3X41_00735 [Leptothrix ochracea]|uniref:hypothetical protein n=1 Tax=Leptothrix ochracea TaxID=735331 RepID=UPI0034E29644
MFDQEEKLVRELIKKANAPVLGLLGGLIPSVARKAIEADLRVSPSAKYFSRRLDQYPALFGIWLAEHVMNGLGLSGHFDVYPHVRKALGGVQELSTPEKELLWRAFRRAMFKLGIQPLPRTYGSHYMIDEYARQAGVPVAFADDLAARMLQLAKRIGLPDEEDQEGILTWQSTLLHRLQPPFSSTARKAVERDGLGYYTRSFLRVFSNRGVPFQGEALDESLAKAFVRDEGSRGIKRAALPQLLYRDGVLGVFFPPTGKETTFEVLCGGRTVSVRSGEGGSFRALPVDLPADVQVIGPDGERLLSAKLWPDRASNRLLVFNDAGRLRATAQLGQGDPVELPPGHYIVLCRFAPTNLHDWDEVSDAPHLVEVLVTLHPGSDVSIVNGSAYVRLAGQNLPSFRLEGTLKAGLERVEFHYGALSAAVEIPQDWRQAQAYEMRVSSGSFSCPIHVVLDQDGTGTVRLDEALTTGDVQPGVLRLVVELARVGEARTLQRQSLLYWHGLQSVSYGLKFSYSARPVNLLKAACSGLKFGPSGAEASNDASRVLRIGFDVGGGYFVHFSWNRPGVFVEVEVPGKDGGSTVSSRPLGATETVSLTTQKSIIVSASEPGYISLGTWKQYVDFGHRPSKVFPASFLASRLEPGARTLTYETESGGASADLLVLSQPHVATTISTSKLANVFEIRVTVQGEPTEVAVTGKDLGSGREARAEHELMAGIWHTNELARMQVYNVTNGSAHVIYVLVDVTTLPPGVWTLGFGARIGGLWGRLEDADEGRIAVAFAVDVVGQEIPGVEVVKAAEFLEERDAIQRLGLLNEHFRSYWSPVCWEQQSWLSQYWSTLLNRFKEREADYVTELIDMIMAKAAADVRQGFQPKQSVGALLTKIFCLPKLEYRKVHAKSHPLSVALRAMPELRGTVVGAFGTTLHQVVAGAFSNIKEMMQGRRPKEFDLAAYRESIRVTTIGDPTRLDDQSFLPGPGELLGPMHLAHAWLDLERGYATSAAMPGPRKSLGIALARLLMQQSSVFDGLAPKGLQGQKVVIEIKLFNSEVVEESEQERQETLLRIANACSWFAWYCRLEVRQEGSLAKLYDNLNRLRWRIELQPNGVSDCIAYYLHVAPAMFAYYLLLWELVLTVELDHGVQNV